MSRKHLQELIRNLQEFYKCPSCETNYHMDDIKFLGQIDTYCFVQLTCHACSLPVLATVTVDAKGKAIGKTDLRPAERAKFSRRGAISASEIAEFHRFLSGHKGSFGKLVK